MWTQARLAKEAGISPTTVSGIETGKIGRPHFGTLGKLARALGVAPEELLDSQEPVEQQGPVPLSVGWARETGEGVFESGLEGASLESLDSLSRGLDVEQGRLQRLYGEFPEGSEQGRFIKRQIRACYELGRKSHRNADFTVSLVPSRSPFPAFLCHF